MAEMEKKQTQISANIPVSVKEKMDRFARATGTTKGHIIEQALHRHLMALSEIPQNFMTPVYGVLSAESAKRVKDMIERPPKPTEAMERLFDDR